MMALKRNSKAAEEDVVTWEDREQVATAKSDAPSEKLEAATNTVRLDKREYAQEGKRRMGTIKNEIWEEELEKE